MADPLESGQFVAEQTTRLLERLAFQVNAAIHSKDANSIHDLRVAIRRFVQILSVCKSNFPARERRKVRRNLKEIMSFAGDVRDRDIAVGLLAKSGTTESAALEEKMKLQRKEAEKVLLAVLRCWGARKFSSKWRSRLLPVQPVGVVPEQVLVPMAQKFFRAGDRAAKPHSSGDSLHRFRILAKKFRYSVEIFQPVYGAVAEEWVGQIKRLQTLLGDMNDYRVAREMIVEMEARASLADSFQRKQEKKADAFRKLWRDEYTGAEKRWARSLERTPRKPVGRAGAPAKIVTLAAR